MLHRCVESLRKQKPDPDVVNRAAQTLGWHLDINAESFHYIGTSTTTTGGPISVFRNVHACAGCYKCGGRRNVERAGPIAPGARRIEYRQRVAIPKRLCFLAHDARET